MSIYGGCDFRVCPTASAVRPGTISLDERLFGHIIPKPMLKVFFSLKKNYPTREMHSGGGVTINTAKSGQKVMKMVDFSLSNHEKYFIE
jgi:hypothetical protein